MNTRPSALRTCSLATLLSLSLMACTTIKVDMPADVPTPKAFEEVGKSPNATATDQDIARWWHGIADPTLIQLIDQGLAANADIRVAVARVKEARTVVTMAESALYPTLMAYGATGRQKFNDVSAPSLPPLPVPVTLPALNVPISSFNGSGFAAAWEVDIFGSRRSDAEAARQAALAYEEKLHGAQMIVAGDIASNYIEARSIERRMDVLARSLSTAQRLQRYAQGRFDAGQANRYDVDRAQAAVEALGAMRAPLQSLLGARLRRLAVLTGQQPEALKALPAPTASAPADGSVIPDQLPGILPSDVLERRPDVRGSANQVRALAARLGSAKAEVLPKFYLGFLSNDGHLEIGNLPSASSSFTAWGAGVKLPIFEGGRIQANIKASDARLEAAAAQYEQAVMSALEDVENAYSARRALDQRALQLTTAWRTSADGAVHAEKLFNEGTGLLQPVLEAKLGALQREDDLIQAQTARALTTVLLYKAIGGGWTANPLPDSKVTPSPAP
ncbi:MAG TPA: TolC family protein [Aquabacterium sp.]|uniref:TolC family protein n=1 Tax=Aquabacterium sp. TaxID=1872578 RepID=UPI002E2F62AB|nr:TolC family protein [Aquabacterium sp.]HEX5356410.1 TolC family protein [Aquabacterium sp.]